MAFKDDVEYFLKKGEGLNYYGLDVNTCNIAEEDDSDGGDGGDASKSTEKKVCPCCGKKKCECDASKSTGTKGGDDDNDGYASVASDSAKMAEMIAELRKNHQLPQNFRVETPEEKQIVAILYDNWKENQCLKSKASVDDKGAGFAPSVKTNNIKEEILKRL